MYADYRSLRLILSRAINTGRENLFGPGRRERFQSDPLTLHADGRVRWRPKSPRLPTAAEYFTRWREPMGLRRQFPSLPPGR